MLFLKISNMDCFGVAQGMLNVILGNCFLHSLKCKEIWNIFCFVLCRKAIQEK